jgi:predicted small lipoprotein YifL
MMWRKFLMVLMLVAVAASLSACGRAGKPVAPDDADPKYPRQYPAPEPVPDSIR